MDSLAGISGNLLAAGEDRETQQEAFECLALADHNLPTEMFLGILKWIGCGIHELFYYLWAYQHSQAGRKDLTASPVIHLD